LLAKPLRQHLTHESRVPPSRSPRRPRLHRRLLPRHDRTGAAPTTQVIQQDWAASWIGGLVPPDPVETAGKCPNGVAKVETQHSLLNMVANVLTLGISTPMTITVTCGTARRAELPTVHGSSDVAASVAEAAALSYASDTPVMLELPR
jgi:hypothetical protein